MGSLEADVLVVGGGIAGVSAAWELAGSARVVVAEAEPSLGVHATGRSAATYTETYGNRVVRALAMAGRPFLESPPSGFADVALLSPRGVLWIGRADQLARLDAAAEEARALVAGVERVDGALAAALCPALDPAYAAGGVWEPGGRDIDVDALLGGFTKGLRTRQGRILTGARVVSARRAAGRWTVETTAGTVGATWVVDAAGAWADEVATLFGARPLGLRPLRRTAFLFDPPGRADPRPWPLVVDVDEAFYFKPEGPRLLGSPADETPSDPCDARPEELDVAVALDRIGAAMGTELRHAHRPWAGLRTFAPDRAPVVGPDPDVEGFCWLAGQGGFGIKTAPALARVAASVVRGSGLPEDVAARGLTEEDLGPGRLRTPRGAGRPPPHGGAGPACA